MTSYEYRVLPAPRRGVKAKGVKGTEAMFAHALELMMNELGAQGWEYQRTDTLPCEERQGLTGRTTNYQNMLVFRRARAASSVAEQPPLQIARQPVEAARPPVPAVQPPGEGRPPALGAATDAAAPDTRPSGDRSTVAAE